MIASRLAGWRRSVGALRLMRALSGACVLAALLLAGCGSAARAPDERRWFTAFTTRAVSDLREGFGLQPTSPPYVGACAGHLADVSWQGAVSAHVRRTMYLPGARGVYDLLGRMLI